MKSLVSLLLLLSLSSADIVVTAIPALKAIGDELVIGTDVELTLITSSETPLNEYVDEIKSRDTLIDSIAGDVVAVLSMRSVMPEDYLFVALRNKNIRIVEIDAIHPLNPSLTAVGTIRTEHGVNPYTWLAPSAVIRSAEIIGKDLIALFPEDSAQIDKNLQSFRESVRLLKNEYEQKFLSLERFEVATMDNSFDYLLEDINLFITLTLPNEMNFSDDDYTNLKQGAEQKTFASIIHKWVPFGKTAKIASSNDISFTVLSTGIPAMNHFDNGILRFLQSNLESIYRGLSPIK